MSNNPAQHHLIIRYQALQHWHAMLDAREKKLVLLLAFLLCGVLLSQLVWKPVEIMRSRAEDSYIDSQATLRWMQAHAAEVKAPDQARPKDNRPLVTIVTDAAQEFKLTFSHIEPSDNGSLRIALENAGFHNVMLWLNKLELENGITTSQVSMEKQETPGMVNVNITLIAH